MGTNAFNLSLSINNVNKNELEILRHVSYGPSDVATIAERFFPHTYGGKGENGSVPDKNSAKYVFQKLRQMQQAEQILILKYDEHPSSIVGLQGYGAKLVCEFYNELIDNMKCTLPRPEELKHDLMASSSLRRIVGDNSQISSGYKVAWYSTEYFYRCYFGNYGKVATTHYPDFQAKVLFQDKSAIFDFEIDGGSMRRKRLFNKIADLQENVVIIGPSSQRLDKIFVDLASAVDIYEKKISSGIIAFPKHLLLVEHQDLITNGLGTSTFKTFPEGNIVHFPFDCFL